MQVKDSVSITIGIVGLAGIPVSIAAPTLWPTLDHKAASALLIVSFALIAGALIFQIAAHLPWRAITGTNPRLQLSFDPDDAGCVRKNTVLTTFYPQPANLAPTQKLCDWYRVKVKNNNDEPVTGAKGKLNRILRDGRPVFDGESIDLPFAMASGPDAFNKTIHKLAPEHVDLAYIVHSDNQLGLGVLDNSGMPSSVNWSQVFREPGEYQFEIVVVSSAKTERLSPRIRWAGLKDDEGPSSPSSPSEITFDPSDERCVEQLSNLYGPTGEKFHVIIQNTGSTTLRNVSVRALPSWFTQTVLHTSRYTHSARNRNVIVILSELERLYPGSPETIELFGVLYRADDDTSLDVENRVSEFTIEMRADDAQAIKKTFEYDPRKRPMLRVVQ